QILEKQIQELRSRQREGELIHQIALSGFATGPLPTAARTLDTVTLDELLVAGVHGFPVAPLPVAEGRLGNILDGQVDVRPAVHIAHGPLVDQSAHCLADLVFVAPNETRPVYRAFVASVK